MKKIQVTKVYEHVDNAIKNGYKIISAQGSSRSGKTYNILIYLILYMLSHPRKSLSIVRRSLPSLKGSVFRDFKEIMIDLLCVWNDKALNKTEMVYTFPNGSFVEFFSTDDEQKIRGRKRNILYCNEANELDFISWQQLAMRTEDFSIIDYNPSFSDDHWICSLDNDASTYFFVSTYKDNPFLSPNIVREIESLQWKNKTLWSVYGLGQRAILEGLVFPTYHTVPEFPSHAKHIALGLDFGFNADPTAVIKCGLLDNRLYLDEVCYKTKMLTNEIIDVLKAEDLFVYADSADPRLIQEITNAGIVIYPCEKFRGSILSGLFKMLEYDIFISERSTNLIKEFKNYSYAVDKDGKYTNKPIDSYNHGIDAARYYVLSKIMGRVLTARTFTKDELGFF